jgi:hypothetical protein
MINKFIAAITGKVDYLPSGPLSPDPQPFSLGRRMIHFYNNLPSDAKTRVKIFGFLGINLVLAAIVLPILARYGLGVPAVLPLLSQNVFSPIVSAMTSNVQGWTIAAGTGGGLLLTISGVCGFLYLSNRHKNRQEHKTSKVEESHYESFGEHHDD